MVEKLVRDKMPGIAELMGRPFSSVRVVGGLERGRWLTRKLVEEALELAAAESPGAQLEELGDILEVLQEVIEALGLSRAEVERHAVAKYEQRGGFRAGMVVEYGPVGSVELLAAEVNALPPWTRAWVHELEARADPASDLRARVAAEDLVAQLTRRVEELEDQLYPDGVPR